MVATNNLPSIDELEAKGWFLSQEGVELIASEHPEATSLDDFIAAAKDMDLRYISNKGWNKTGDKVVQLPSPLVLQLLEVRNIAMPSANQVEKPRLLSATFTDGKKKYKGAEVTGSVDCLKLHTPPGTKFLVKKPIDFQDQVLILGPGMLEDIGGHVQELVQAWRAGKQFLKRFGGKATAGKQDEQEGPPVFVPFKVKNPPRSTDKSRKSIKKEETANGHIHERENNNKKNGKNPRKDRKIESVIPGSEKPLSDNKAPRDQSRDQPKDKPREEEQPKSATEKKPRAKKAKKPPTNEKQPPTVQPKSQQPPSNDEKTEQAPKKEKRKKRERGPQKRDDLSESGAKEKNVILQNDISTPPSEQQAQIASVDKPPADSVQTLTPPPEQREKKTSNRKKRGSRKDENGLEQQQHPQRKESETSSAQQVVKSNTKADQPEGNKRNSLDSGSFDKIQKKNEKVVDAKKDHPSLQAQNAPEKHSISETPTTNKRKTRNKNKKKVDQEIVHEENPSPGEKQKTEEVVVMDNNEPPQSAEPPTQKKTRGGKKDRPQRNVGQDEPPATGEQQMDSAEKKHAKKKAPRRPSKQLDKQTMKDAAEPVQKEDEELNRKQLKKSKQRSKRTREQKGSEEAEAIMPPATTEQDINKPTSLSLPPPTPPSNEAAQTNSNTPVAHAITTNNNNVTNESNSSPSHGAAANRTAQVAGQPFYEDHRNSNPYLSRSMEPYYGAELYQPMATTAPAHHPIPPSPQQHEYYYQHPQPVYPMIDYNMMVPYDYTTGMPAGMYNYPPTPAPLPPLVPSQQPSQPTQPQQTQPYMQPMYYIPDIASQQQQSPGYYNHQMHYTQLYDDVYYRDYNSRGRGRGMASSHARGRGRGELK